VVALEKKSKLYNLRKVFGPVYGTHLGWRLKHNEELYEFDKPDIVKNIKFKSWQCSGPIVRIDYTRILQQVLNGEFMKEAPLEEHGRDGKNVRRRKRLLRYRNIR
jgi:hypothetical protein